MATSKHATPKWLTPYLRYRLWTQWELLNILCGLRPVPPGDAPPKPQTQLRDEAKHRDAADRHVTDAIRMGDLTVEPSIANQRLLDNITPHVAEPMRSEIHRAVAAARLYSLAYHVKVDVAIRWAVSQRKLFPRCPLKVEHLMDSDTAIATAPLTIADVTTTIPAFPNQVERLVDDTTEQDVRAGASKTKALRKLRKFRYALIDTYQDTHEINDRKEFYEQLGISRAALEGIVRDESRKYAPDVKAKLLNVLGVSSKEWNNPQ